MEDETVVDGTDESTDELVVEEPVESEPARKARIQGNMKATAAKTTADRQHNKYCHLQDDEPEAEEPVAEEVESEGDGS